MYEGLQTARTNGAGCAAIAFSKAIIPTGREPAMPMATQQS